MCVCIPIGGLSVERGGGWTFLRVRLSPSTGFRLKAETMELYKIFVGCM